MPNDPHDPNTAGGELPKGQTGGSTPAGQDPTPAGDAPAATEKSKGGDQVVTSAVLSGVVMAQKRAFQEMLDKTLSTVTEGFSKTLEERLAAIQASKHVPDDEGKGGKSRAVESPELVELRRQHDLSKAEIDRMRADLQKAQDEKRRFKKETIVRDALVKFGCSNVDVLLPWLNPQLSFDEDKGRVFTTVEGPYGSEELGVEDYIKRVIREEKVPQLFQPIVKAGSPAGGDDQAAGGRKWLFTKEQIDDTAYYAEHAKEIREALDKGLVKGVVRGTG